MARLDGQNYDPAPNEILREGPSKMLFVPALIAGRSGRSDLWVSMAARFSDLYLSFSNLYLMPESTGLCQQ